MGFSDLIMFDWNDTIRISDIFIHPNSFGLGLAMRLIRQDIEEAKNTKYRPLIAEAPSLNPITRLYEELGFRKCEYDDRYYSNCG